MFRRHGLKIKCYTQNLNNKTMEIITSIMTRSVSEANKDFTNEEEAWDLGKMEELRKKNAELREVINYNIETIEIIARKYRTDK
jgi:hypothetical protein